MATNKLGEFRQLLGQSLERGLRTERQSFAELASQVLQRNPAPSLDATAVADWMIAAGNLPKQVSFTSGFGEPPLVVYQAPEFYIEVLFWLVARSCGDEDPRQLRFHGNGFAIVSGGDRSIVSRQAGVLIAVYLGKPPAFAPRLISLLEQVDDWHFYYLLESLLDLLKVAKFTSDVLPLIDARFASQRPHALGAIRDRVRTRGIWTTMRTPPYYIPKWEVQAALADFFPDSVQRREIICRSYGIAQLSELPERWRSLVCDSS